MSKKEIPYKIYLDESEMPKQWYNLRADMINKPAPLLNPATGKPVTLEELSGIFCEELAKQELDDKTPYIDIPDEILQFYKMYRPAPLVRAYHLERYLKTPAKIYYKFEGNNTSGSHKLNSAIAQAYYAKNQGLKGVTTETGAGQWGTALSMACAFLGLDCQVFMVKVSYEQKPFRREVMRTYGAIKPPKFEPPPAQPIMISGFAPFMGEKLRGEADYRFIAVEPKSCPSLTRGTYAYDFCDTGAICPLAKMYTLGSSFMPAPNHAGGLRYHGMSSVLSQLYDDKLMEAVSVSQTDVFAAAEEFAKVEGILPAPESSHAIRVAMDEAIKCRETGEEKTILFGLTGTGYFDMYAYEKFNDGKMENYTLTDEEIAASIAKLPKVPGLN